MKHLLLFATLISSLLFTSCNDEKESLIPGTYPDTASYAVTRVVEDLENEDGLAIYFTLDNGKDLFLSDDQLAVDYGYSNGQRVVIYYAVIEDYSTDEGAALEGAAYECDYGVRLFGIRKVYTTEAATVTTQEESDAIADHAVSYIYNSVTTSNGYINMVAALRADKMENIKLYLVENLNDEPELSAAGYLNLELRYDRGTTEAMGSTYEEYVALDLAPFATQLEGKKGVILRAITLNSGTINVKIDIDEDDNISRTINSNKASTPLLVK